MEYAEFKQRVVDLALSRGLKTVPKDKAMEYIEAEDEYIRDMYRYRKEAIEAGRVTGYGPGISTAAHGLGMMY